MDPIILAILLVATLIILQSIVVVVASIITHVPLNKFVEDILDVLPGSNCGDCECTGCSEYAKSIIDDDNSITKCTPGGIECVQKISRILGEIDDEDETPKAMLACGGTTDHTKRDIDFEGETPTCELAKSKYGGENSCPFGCLGYGDCIDACRHDAISIIDGIAYIDREECVGCGLCTLKCPKHLLSVIPYHSRKPVVMCLSKNKPVETINSCKGGCIGCQKCVKACPEKAIEVTHYLAKIDQEKCIGCQICVNTCPNKVIVVPENY